MLAGWITLEARLASAFIVLLVFAVGMGPARRMQAGAAQAIVVSPQPPSRPSRHGEGRLTLTAMDGEQGFNRADRAAMGLANALPDPGVQPMGELELLNHDRARAGLPPLAPSASLDGVADTRASQLVADGIAHYRPGHSMLAAVELLQASHIPYVWHGENIIWEGGMPWAEVPAFFNSWWMASPAHRDNILNPHYRSVGIGIAKNGDAVYMVEVFTDQGGDPIATPSLPSPPSPPSPPEGGRS